MPRKFDSYFPTIALTGLLALFGFRAAAQSPRFRGGRAVSISPVSATVPTGGTQQFTATVSGSRNEGVTWSATGGTVSSSGLYIAPTAAGTYTVTVTSEANSNNSASATVTVTDPSVVAVSISPGSASLLTGSTQQFTATITGTSNTAVTWSTTGGTVSTNGLYTAPVAAGTYTVTAISVADTSKSASAAITVTVPSAQPVAFVQIAAATPQSPQSSVTVIYPAAQSAGDLNVVVVGWNDSTSSVTSVSDSNGNAYSVAVGPVTGTGLSQSIYYAKDIVSGGNAVTVTFNQAASFPDIRILEYAGLDTVSPLDVTAAAAGNSSSASSGPATTTATNELILGADTIATTTTGVGSGFTSRIITSPDGNLVEDKIVSTAGSYSAAASLSSGSWVMQMAIFKGAGSAAAAGQLTVSPTTLGLGSVVVGTSGTASGTLTASGANVTVTAASSSNSVFSLGGLSLPVTIPAGQSAPFTVTFSPQTTGAVSGTLIFTGNPQFSMTETLTGTGTPAPTYDVYLSWTASASSNVSGYNVYRAAYTNSCETFTKINSSLNTTTSYTDSVVTDGTSYCYATTTVNTSNNEESGYSNIVSNIQIPVP